MKTKQPLATADNHRVGDKLIIRNDYYLHGFEIGTKVEIMSVGENEYKAKSEDGEYWWVADANFKTEKELTL